MPEIVGMTGCILDPAVKEQFWASLPFQNIMQAAPDFLALDDDADIFLFDAEAQYLKTLTDAGLPIPWPTTKIGQTLYLLNHHQTTYDCTSHATSGATEDLEMVDISWRGLAETFNLIASEPLYGGAIVTIMHTHGDNGAYTSAPLAYASANGFLSRQKYGDIDLTTYSGSRATQYSKQGVPTTLLESQKTHVLVNKVPVHSFDEGSGFLRQGYSIVGGSNTGFTMTRDKDGFCTRKGNWAHCTRFRGRRGGKKPGWAYGQSWGPGMPGGPATVTLDSGRSLNLPEGTFFVDPDTINSMIKQGEFYALGKIQGFVSLDYKLF